MRVKLFLSLLSLIPSFLFSQSPQSIPYQAVVRNVDGTAMSNSALTMIFKIHDQSATGTVVYEESHAITSNAQGLVSCNVGNGTPTQGTFASINWGNGAKFLHVLMNAGNGELDLGTQQMMSVPYALYSTQSENGISRVSISGDSLILSNGSFVLIPGVSALNHPVYGCADIQACNFNVLANHNDNSCFYIDSGCDDGNPLTFYDYVNIDCLCQGTEFPPRLIPDDGVSCLHDTLPLIAPEGVVITSVNQIHQIMLNLEHSYMNDLSIKLICPNSSEIFLHQNGGGGTYLGEPIDVDSDSSFGIGYNYYWSPVSNNGTWLSNSNPGGTLPSGTYEPAQAFNSLIGCPINGNWIIEICDVAQSDDGYVFDSGLSITW